jgi:ferredoxin-NADP reductase
MIIPKKYTATLVNRINGENLFIIECLLDTNISFIPGQFCIFFLQIENEKYQRFYSVLSLVGNKIQFLLSKSGYISNYLSEVDLGYTVEISNPMGMFMLKNDLKIDTLLLCATGSGISPFYSYIPTIQSFLERKSIKRCLILYGVSNEKDLLLQKQFELAFHNYEQFTEIHIAISKQDCLPQNYGITYFHKERVTSLLNKFNFSYTEKEFLYLCGNPNMVKEVEVIISQKNLPTIIKKEIFISLCNYRKI